MPIHPSEARWLSSVQQQAWRAYLLGSARLSELLDADLQQFGLDLPEYEILVVLSESSDRRVRMSELAAAVHQSRSRVTHTVSRMEKQGLVERVGFPADRRGVWAWLTAGGMELLETAAPTHVAAVRQSFLDVVGPADFETVGRAFAAVAAAAEEALPGSRRPSEPDPRRAAEGAQPSTQPTNGR